VVVRGRLAGGGRRGRFFAEWGQPLAADRVGQSRLGAGEVVRVYRNGTLAGGDPSRLRFAAHAEVVVWVGPSSQPPRVPASYAFPPSL
jgi:hypothetical protein